MALVREHAPALLRLTRAIAGTAMTREQLAAELALGILGSSDFDEAAALERVYRMANVVQACMDGEGFRREGLTRDESLTQTFIAARPAPVLCCPDCSHAARNGGICPFVTGGVPQ